MKSESLHVLVEGLVQGVGYRQATYREATRLGLTGWVRNLPNGQVEFHACGAREKLEALAAWAKRGPALAEVSSIHADWGESEHTEFEFQICFDAD